MISVSALMATTSKRAAFRPRAAECFHQQQYPLDWEVNLVVHDHETDTLGAKLNRMVEFGTSDYLITWDDDDFHSPTRIARQIKPLVTGEYGYSGTSQIFYHNIVTDEGWLYKGTPRIWLGGFAFTRCLWEKQKFRDITVGVDTTWQRLAQTEYKAKFFDVADPALFVASMHPGNSCPKNTTTCSWSPATLPEFTRL
jgi:hypothetical protein